MTDGLRENLPSIILKNSWIILCLSLLSACSHLGYYSQAIRGQWEIFKHSQPIVHVIADPSLSTSLKQQLLDILKIRTFATKELHLPDNDSYISYADLGRPYAVWSVFATPAFSFQPKQWCFLIVGCVNYRGYFTEASAQALATQLRAQGYDVYVAGIAAYSTLGWFDDPVLNTMLEWPQFQIAGLIFHELAHQKLYIKNDTAFNEAFAMTIEYVGIERWLKQYGTSEALTHYQQWRQRHAEFIDLVLTTRNHLQNIYQNQGAVNQLLPAKTAAFEILRAQYALLKKRWNGYNGYDNWFAKDLNNAKLLSIATYQDYVPAFQALLAKKKGNLPAFYQAVTQLGQLSREERRKKLLVIDK